MCAYFQAQKVDFALIEVGIGGRLDVTNVLSKPLISIITSIGYDHQERLGNTLKLITKEKAEIIKANSCVVVGKMSGCLFDIFKMKAQSLNSQVKRVSYAGIKLNQGHFTYQNVDYCLKSQATYQLNNALCALKACEFLKTVYNYNLETRVIKRALANTLWRGRFEVVSQKPLVILDGAHNIDGIKALKSSIEALNLKPAILFSALKDKEVSKMLKLLKPISKEIVLTSFVNERLYDYEHSKLINEFTYIKDYQKAFNFLKARYDEIVVCGSLYFISEINQFLKKS